MRTVISQKNIKIKEVILPILFFNTSLISVFYSLWVDNLKNISLLELINIPLFLIVTLIVHEFIHVFLFKKFSNNNAIIKVIRDKELKSIIIKQTNEKVFYTKKQVLIIILSPLIIITLISFLFQIIFPYSFLIMINNILNILGSNVDFISSYKLIKIKNVEKINFTYPNNKVEMNIYIKEK